MDIRKAEYIISSPSAGKCPATEAPEYAFIGRSNVGKSSLINMLCRRKGLAKTSQTPGKTLLINHFAINDGEWYMVDLPGYGYAARGQKQREEFKRMIDDYAFNRWQMVNLFVLVDARHAPQRIDLEFINRLGEHGVPFAIVFTKADKLSKLALEKNVDLYKRTLLEYWEELPLMFITSADKGTGRDELLAYIDSLSRQWNETESYEHDPQEESDSPDSGLQ